MTGPRRIGGAIAGVRSAAMPRTLLAAAQQAWPAAVGERIAAEAQPTVERDGIVTISCRAATWAAQLDLLHDQLLARLNEQLERRVGDQDAGAGAPVRRLRFTAAAGD